MSNVYPIGPLDNDARRVRQLERDVTETARQIVVYREIVENMVDVAQNLRNQLARFSHEFYVNEVDKLLDLADEAIGSARRTVGE